MASSAVIPVACIDIGTNTTRLLVAESDAGGRLREVMAQRVFTRIGRSLSRGGRIPADKIAQVVEVVAVQARQAGELGAGRIEVVATAAVREASNGVDLVTAIEEATGLAPRLLTGDEEARLAFAGATKTLAEPVTGELAVVDVGGGSTEIAVGTVGAGVSWCESFRIGSGLLADAYLHSDPPAVAELEALRSHTRGVFEGLELPPVDSAVAVGGSATSLRRLVGGSMDRQAFERALRLLAHSPIGDLARRFALEPERVRLLPAGIAVLGELSDRLAMPLSIVKGGVREGIVLELLAGDGHGANGTRADPPA